MPWNADLAQHQGCPGKERGDDMYTSCRTWPEADLVLLCAAES